MADDLDAGRHRAALGGLDGIERADRHHAQSLAPAPVGVQLFHNQPITHRRSYDHRRKQHPPPHKTPAARPGSRKPRSRSSLSRSANRKRKLPRCARNSPTKNASLPNCSRPARCSKRSNTQRSCPYTATPLFHTHTEELMRQRHTQSAPRQIEAAPA